MPNWIARLVAKRNSIMRSALPLLGINLNATGRKAHARLDPRSREDAIVATAESLIQLGLVNG
jgi:dihydroflavonol-4-reductase